MTISCLDIDGTHSGELRSFARQFRTEKLIWTRIPNSATSHEHGKNAKIYTDAVTRNALVRRVAWSWHRRGSWRGWTRCVQR